jgi:hypothetical protein
VYCKGAVVFEIGMGNMDWIDLAENIDRWHTVVNFVVSHRDP